VIRVLLADDQALVRSGLRVLLESEEDIELAGEAADGHEAIALARQTFPDVVLMDVSMPGMDGVEATRRITADERLADSKVLVLTTYGSDEHIFGALRAGASGFLLKDAEPAELLRGIRVVADGAALLAPCVTTRLIAEFASQPRRGESPKQLEWLTEREREVTALVAAGLSNDEIAGRLVISPATAKTHVSRAMRKVHAHDRAQLVVLAYESGLVVPGRQPVQAAPSSPTQLHAVG
jgi:DNA-binding NarL/FixJ family response regulator